MSILPGEVETRRGNGKCKACRKVNQEDIVIDETLQWTVEDAPEAGIK